MYCPNCGEELPEAAEYCPNCGDFLGTTNEDKTRIGERGYTLLGTISGLIALLLFPPVFGIISIFSGIQLFRHYDERRGIALIIWGSITLISGILIGIYVFTN